MKKPIKALACAAMLAIAGTNVYTAMGSNESAELQIDGVENMAEGESNTNWGQKGYDRYYGYANYLGKDAYNDDLYFCKCMTGSVFHENPFVECCLDLYYTSSGRTSSSALWYWR